MPLQIRNGEVGRWEFLDVDYVRSTLGRRVAFICGSIHRMSALGMDGEEDGHCQQDGDEGDLRNVHGG